VVDNTSKRQQRIKFFKFFLRVVPFIIVIAVFGAYLIVAAYFMDAFIMTAYTTT
jgi:phage shock protein PspC (stress-responsive transcriptional regulator)